MCITVWTIAMWCRANTQLTVSRRPRQSDFQKPSSLKFKPTQHIVKGDITSQWHRKMFRERGAGTEATQRLTVFPHEVQGKKLRPIFWAVKKQLS